MNGVLDGSSHNFGRTKIISCYKQYIYVVTTGGEWKIYYSKCTRNLLIVLYFYKLKHIIITQFWFHSYLIIINSKVKLVGERKKCTACICRGHQSPPHFCEYLWFSLVLLTSHLDEAFGRSWFYYVFNYSNFAFERSRTKWQEELFFFSLNFFHKIRKLKKLVVKVGRKREREELENWRSI